VRMEGLELSKTPLRIEVRGPRSRSRDVVVLLPRPALVGPPLAPAVSASFHEREVGGVRERRAGNLITAHIRVVTRSLVVIGEGAAGGADRACTSWNLDEVKPGGGVGRRWVWPALRRLIVGQPRQLERLEHRLAVLLLVAQDQLRNQCVRRAALVQRLQRALPDLGQIVTGLGGTEEGKFSAAGARGLEGVVDV